MRADPTDHGHGWISSVRTGRRPESVRINHGRDDDGIGSLAPHVLGDRPVAAGHHAGPANEAVGLAGPLQHLAKATVGRAGVGDVGGIVQIENQRAMTDFPCEPLDQGRAEDHGFALHEQDVDVTGGEHVREAPDTGSHEPQ